MSSEIFIAPKGAFDELDVWLWYRNIPLELEFLDLSQIEKEHFEHYYQEAGLLSTMKKGFFRQHYSETFSIAASFLLSRKRRNVTVLDIGAGTGTQSIFFALQGTKVIALDMDPIALNILRKRKAFYEEKLGYTLDIEICEQNAFDFELTDDSKIDAIYSMFAFNMMQPSDKFIEKLFCYLERDARLCILDGNNKSWLSYLVPSRRRPNVWSPQEFSDNLRRRHFRIINHHGGVSLPPVFWSLPILRNVSKFLDNRIKQSWLFSISHQIMAQLDLPNAK